MLRFHKPWRIAPEVIRFFVTSCGLTILTPQTEGSSCIKHAQTAASTVLSRHYANVVLNEASFRCCLAIVRVTWHLRTSTAFETLPLTSSLDISLHSLNSILYFLFISIFHFTSLNDCVSTQRCECQGPLQGNPRRRWWVACQKEQEWETVDLRLVKTRQNLKIGRKIQEKLPQKNQKNSNQGQAGVANNELSSGNFIEWWPWRSCLMLSVYYLYDPFVYCCSNLLSSPSSPSPTFVSPLLSSQIILKGRRLKSQL